MRYESFQGLIGNVLTIDDNVIFQRKDVDETYFYDVRKGYLYHRIVRNSELYEKLGLNTVGKMDVFVTTLVGQVHWNGAVNLDFRGEDNMLHLTKFTLGIFLMTEGIGNKLDYASSDDEVKYTAEALKAYIERGYRKKFTNNSINPTTDVGIIVPRKVAAISSGPRINGTTVQGKRVRTSIEVRRLSYSEISG